MKKILEDTIHLSSLDSYTPVYHHFQNYRVGSSPDSLMVFLTHLVPSSPVMVVFFSHYTTGTVENKLTPEVPYYARWSWAPKLSPHCSCLYVDDCSSQDEADGFKRTYWYLGKGLMERCALMIRKIRDVCNVPPTNLVFCGASMGGFASLSMMRYFPDAVSLVCNSQTNLYYYWPTHVKKIEAFLQRPLTPEETNVAVHLTREARIVYLQCEQDVHHMNHHYQRFRDLTTDYPNIRYKLFQDEKGHNAGCNVSDFETFLQEEFGIGIGIGITL